MRGIGYPQATLQASHGPVASTMTIKATATGVESLTQTVLLYHDVRRIDFVLDLVKSPSGRRNTHTNSDPVNKESVYISLPLAVPEPQIRHALPGCVAAPVSDLFEGACTAFYAVRHFSDASGKEFGVTVSAPDSSLFEYGHPRSCPIRSGGEALFERDRTPPANSHMYLYLMNNMFDVNVRWDQPGPVQFCYSLRSHADDWRNGKADEFGWDILNPLLATVVDGASQGASPFFFLQFSDDRQRECHVHDIETGRADGVGMIVRLVETQGLATDVRMNMRFLPPIAAAVETSLIEDDRAAPLEVDGDNVVRVSLPTFRGQDGPSHLPFDGAVDHRPAGNRRLGHGSRIVLEAGTDGGRETSIRIIPWHSIESIVIQNLTFSRRCSTSCSAAPTPSVSIGRN